jgi:F-type H+-transporting ATPase subunit beta
MANVTYGKVTQVIGAVVDVRFKPGELPDLMNAITIKSEDQDSSARVIADLDVTLEAMQLLGNDTVRCVALSPTDGIMRGMKATNTAAAIKIPVGDGCLGRILNVLGREVDNAGPVNASEYWEIHRNPRH